MAAKTTLHLILYINPSQPTPSTKLLHHCGPIGAYTINCGGVRDLTPDEWDEFSCAYPDAVRPEGTC